MRKWGDSAPTEDDMASLDFSASPSAASISNSEGLSLSGFVDENSYGKRGKDGLYEVKDWEVSGAGKDDDDDMISSALNSANAPKSNTATTSSGVFSSLFSRFTGSKLLTKEDLEGVLAGMREHLMKKNVAKEIADKICDDVQRGLVGKKVGSFGSKSLSVCGPPMASNTPM
jgi:signal recognition particle receptor subunit alpha